MRSGHALGIRVRIDLLWVVILIVMEAIATASSLLHQTVGAVRAAALGV